MTDYRGDYPVGATVRMLFHTFNAAGGSVTITGFSASDIVVYKNLSTTERASANGYTATTDFDTLTGLHIVSVDTSDNSDAGFYAAGNEYQVMVASITVDGQTVRFWAGQFSIERAGGALALIKDATNGLTAIKTAVVAVDDFVDTEITDIQSRIPAALVSGRIDASVGAAAANTITASALATDAVTEVVNAILASIYTTGMVESYSTKGGTISLAQLAYELIQQRQEVATGGTVTETVKKRDQSTTALTLTLNNAVVPTSITRAT